MGRKLNGNENPVVIPVAIIPNGLYRDATITDKSGELEIQRRQVGLSLKQT